MRGLLWNDKRRKRDQYGRTWATVWTELKNLKTLGYTVKWKILNTRHYGIPQNRERVFMVGSLKGAFDWPEPTKMNEIHTYVDHTDGHRVPPEIGVYTSRLFDNIPNSAIFVDLAFKKHNFPNAGSYSLCISANSRIWNVPKGRYANSKELLQLQGFPPSFVVSVSFAQLRKQLGNSMSVNVVSSIFKKLLQPTNCA